MLGDALHLGALASAALGVCCVAARAPRRRVALLVFELGMSALMLAAMIDVTFVHALAAVWWSMLVCAAALISVVVRRSAPRGRPRAMVGLEAVGAIAMAGLLMVMAGAVPAGAVGGQDVGHHGGGSAAALAWILAGGASAYAVCALVFAVRDREESLLARLAPATGGASVLLMAAAAVCG